MFRRWCGERHVQQGLPQAARQPLAPLPRMKTSIRTGAGRESGHPVVQRRPAVFDRAGMGIDLTEDEPKSGGCGPPERAAVVRCNQLQVNRLSPGR